MARQKVGSEDTRKLSQFSSGSYFVTLPVASIRNLGWRDGQKLTVQQEGDKLVIKDWS